MYHRVNNYENPEKFSQKLESLKQQLPHILDDYNKYSVLYNKNPDYNEYQQSFNRIQGNLNQLNSELFMLSNNVQSETDNINKYLNQLNTLISIEKTTRTDLKKQLGNIESENNATTEMIINYKEMYNNGYLRNWGLLLSIVLAGYAISKVYSSKIVNSTPLK
jgi:chromosome segregation ATPase